MTYHDRARGFSVAACGLCLSHPISISDVVRGFPRWLRDWTKNCTVGSGNTFSCLPWPHPVSQRHKRSLTQFCFSPAKKSTITVRIGHNFTQPLKSSQSLSIWRQTCKMKKQRLSWECTHTLVHTKGHISLCPFNCCFPSIMQVNQLAAIVLLL